MKAKIAEEIEMPDGVTARIQDDLLAVAGPKGEVQRLLRYPQIKVEVKGTAIILSCEKATKRQKRVLHTFRAHVNNMVKGVQTPYQYKLKICSGHFPMNVSLNGDQFAIKNFLGEKSPRTITIKKGAEVKINGDEIVIESPDKEKAGQIASDIELLTVKRNRDLRIFQDGIYIVEKAGKPVGGK